MEGSDTSIEHLQRLRQEQTDSTLEQVTWGIGTLAVHQEVADVPHGDDAEERIGVGRAQDFRGDEELTGDYSGVERELSVSVS